MDCLTYKLLFCGMLLAASVTCYTIEPQKRGTFYPVPFSGVFAFIFLFAAIFM